MLDVYSSVCVCVSNPVSKGPFLFLPITISRGHGSCFPSHANEAMGFSRKGMWAHIPAPAIGTFDYAVTPLSSFWFMVFSWYFP